jgi:sialate O-acetylesterase
MLIQGTVLRSAESAPIDETSIKWRACGPETAGDFSAVAYYFGKMLRKQLGCPVGILNGARGGTRIEAWMSDEALKPFEGLYDPRRPKNGSDSANWNTASALYNGIIAPVVRFPVRGVIWYQGESNAGIDELYRKTFPALIADWRKAWGSELPFLFVQLAGYQKIVSEPQESEWAELRDAQLLAANTVPNTAMAVITDCGDPDDIHPKRKKPVGERLALAARALAYGEDVVYKGPSFRSMTVVGNRAVLEFDNAESGLVAKRTVFVSDSTLFNNPDGGIAGNGRDVTGFAVAGADRKFHNARATIQGARVVVSSDAVVSPAAVRYGWADCPVANLFNGAGLPASPFSTDTLRPTGGNG